MTEMEDVIRSVPIDRIADLLEPEPLMGATPSAPLAPGKIVAIGLNYVDHAREAGLDAPAEPVAFAKFPSSVIGPSDPIVIERRLTDRVDWEVELGVIIRGRLRNIPAERGLDGVFGYTVANDVSARDLQFRDGQWVRGKSLDTFAHSDRSSSPPTRSRIHSTCGCGSASTARRCRTPPLPR